MPDISDTNNPFENNELDQGDVVDCLAGKECPAYAMAAMFDGFEQRHYAYCK